MLYTTKCCIQGSSQLLAHTKKNSLQQKKFIRLLRFKRYLHYRSTSIYNILFNDLLPEFIAHINIKYKYE